MKNNAVDQRQTCSRSLIHLAHQHGVTGIVSNNNVFISSDTNGTIIVWNIKTMLQIHVIQPTDESGITSLALWNSCLAAGYANGMIRVFDIDHGECRASHLHVDMTTDKSIFQRRSAARLLLMLEVSTRSIVMQMVFWSLWATIVLFECGVYQVTPRIYK